jgi:predicted nucleic acid-binding protein
LVGLLDTSAFIAIEQERLIGRLPDEVAVPVVALAELRLGVLMAKSDEARIVRLSTLVFALALSPVPIDARVGEVWAELVSRLKGVGRRMPLNDSWIAAIAIANEMVIVTQDRDYDVVPGLEVVQI